MYITPIDQAKVDAIIAACCEFYQIEKQLLIDSRERSIVEMRQQCCYLISKNTKLTQEALAETFNRKRPAIINGIKLAEFDATKHPSVKYILKEIIFKANTNTNYVYSFCLD